MVRKKQIIQPLLQNVLIEKPVVSSKPFHGAGQRIDSQHLRKAIHNLLHIGSAISCFFHGTAHAKTVEN